MIAKNYYKSDSDEQNNSDEENDNDEQKNLSSLDDHCILVILEKLTLDDLSEMSQTCKRFHGLCVNQFQHRYREKVFIVNGVFNDGTPIYGPRDKKYSAAFAKYAQNIIFDTECANEATLQQLSTYYAKPNVASIKHLGFQFWIMEKSHSRFFGLPDIFKSNLHLGKIHLKNLHIIQIFRIYKMLLIIISFKKFVI